MTLLAVMAALIAGLLLAGSPVARLRHVVAPRERAGPRAKRVGRVLAPGLVVALVCTGGFLGGAAGAVIVFSVSAPLVTAAVVWRRHAERAAAVARAAATAEACRHLAGLVRVGHVPAAALREAARDSPLLSEVVAVQQVGGAVTPVLRRLARLPGGDGLAELATAWEVAERSGASLGATLDALAGRQAGADAVRDVVSAELAAPRATGRLLAVLPVAGLLLGYGLGGDPLRFLTGSPAGQFSLVVGVMLGCAGVFWTERIADGGDV